ncbi:PTS sugar transporter subunit IIA [Tetragenococcus koreensis]|uniref:PTS EIIA type-4 domain-containing protein n=1 Tax=Tetragenococcus koreensis TaxID=290335 RepID=A0AAN4UCR4_9ENTE|nr:PTS sugar transporter subunit IIA [Tetragenococcus koreensis]MCF1618140.1 PTS sugar transporter subunit IIA [Tetragenococcus koreensis]MCF1623005.1 PTS sugar transporter subunit IIA [Tetragenococcus koreensis]MCF1627194.1 PTS sugar transporter subunit IIA [Tetragenococcus koreensis]MCF1632652.1 PTS sugar transporter subunit IIA [Tetragenococcus koreensis]MCF1678981.1 PTS sugar transporter subunit IIA [Tetragenococcus koreensis]
MNIVVASHGLFSKELIKSAEMITGKMERVYSISLLPNESLETLTEKAEKLLKSLGDETIVLVDLFGGTPCNVFTILLKKYDYQLFTAVSLPMLIDLYLKLSTEEQFNPQQWFEEYQNNITEGTVAVKEKLE